VGPQDDVPVSEKRIWVDGCFDFAHHGHAGAMLQARQLGDELLVGVHSDKAILDNKGPTVMRLDERCASYGR
jgi:ethanolamine-phosphate cytidylyltransferase